MGSRLNVTVPLTLAAFVLAVLIGVPAGFAAAYKRRTWYGALLSGVSQLGIAVPLFWLGMILIAVFALNAGWLPAGGFPPEGWAQPAEAIRSLVLPVVTIALVMSASLIRYVRSATLDVLDSDYLRTARALGSSFGRAMWRRGLRNASVPVISILGIELASTLLGAVVVESVYALPGLGSMLATGSGRVQGDPSNSLANTVSAPGVLLGNLPYGHGISAAQHQCPGCGITSRPS